MSRLLRIALLAYPRERRERDGAVLLDCAAELTASGSSSGWREAAGLVRGGLATRLAVARGDLRAAPWDAAAAQLAVPLAGANLAWWLVGASAAGPPGRWWPAMLAGAGLALLGAVTRRRWLALAGWALTALLLAQTLLRGETDQSVGSRFDGMVGSYTVDLAAAFAPVVLLGLATATRVRGTARIADLAWLAPAIALLGISGPDPGGPFGESPAQTLLLAGLLVTPFALLLLARGDRVRLAGAAAVAAAVAPEAVWLSTIPVPYPGPVGALAVLAALGLLATLGVLTVARRAGRAS